MRRSMAAGAFLLAALTALMPTGSTVAGARPSMKLRVSTHSGPTPLDLELSGSYKGVTPAELSGCLVTVEWFYRTPGGSDLTTKEELPCIDGETVPASFKKSFMLKEPGTYSYRMVLIDSKGKWMASTSQEVKVYKSHFEAGARGTHSEN